jgi:hypothetical protein
MGNSATFYSVLVEVELSQNSDQLYVAEGGDFQATHSIAVSGLKNRGQGRSFGRYPLLYRIIAVFLHPRG